MASVTDVMATRAEAASRRLGNWGHRNARWLFPAPAVLLVAAIIVYPIVYTVWMSLQDWFASSLTAPKFIGLANYQKILVGDPRFREAVVRTLYFTGLVIAGETVLGVAMALLFNREFWGRGPPADARDPADGGDPGRHRPRVRDDVPPDARRGELHGQPHRPGAVQVDLLERDGALRARGRRHLAVDAAHHADRAGRAGQPAPGALRGGPHRRRHRRCRPSGTSRCRCSGPPSSSRSSSGRSTRSRPSTSSSS